MTTTVSVRGNATREVSPDFALISLTVRSSNPQRELAQALATNTVTALREALADSTVTGVHDVKFSRIGSYREASSDAGRPNQVDGDWLVSASAQIKTTVTDAPATLMLLSQFDVHIIGVHWGLEELNSAYREVRKDAVEAAVRAANDFASGLGAKLGDPVRLSDPGLLDSESTYQARSAPTPPGAPTLSVGSGPQEDTLNFMNIDPEPVVVCASVEAIFAIKLNS
jgi:uncharacterized protein YggE